MRERRSRGQKEEGGARRKEEKEEGRREEKRKRQLRKLEHVGLTSACLCVASNMFKIFRGRDGDIQWVGAAIPSAHSRATIPVCRVRMSGVCLMRVVRVRGTRHAVVYSESVHVLWGCMCECH